MNDIIPEDVLKTLEERFGSRFVRRTDGEDAPDTAPRRRGGEPGRGRAGGHLVDSRGAAAREGYGTKGLPHQCAQIHGGRLAGRKRDRSWLLRVWLAASERPLGRGRSSRRRTEHHRRQRSIETLRRVQR